MSPWAELQFIAQNAGDPALLSCVNSSAVWALTLWTADRSPLLVGLNGDGIGLSRLGLVARQHWEDLEARFPGIASADFAILPDRIRALVNVPWGQRIGNMDRMIRWFKLKVERSARKTRAIGRLALWEPGFEAHLVASAEELWFWRRRIRAGLAGALAPASR